MREREREREREKEKREGGRKQKDEEGWRERQIYGQKEGNGTAFSPK